MISANFITGITIGAKNGTAKWMEKQFIHALSNARKANFKDEIY